jgi:hypothetical protein
MTDLQSALIRQFGLRVGSEMALYIHRNQNQQPNLPVIGGDARTGIPRWQIIQTQQLPKDPTLAREK